MIGLTEAIRRTEVPEVPAHFEKIVESDLATLFFTTDQVYKIYKPSNNYSLNFSDPTILLKFLDDDILWNTTLSPEIYLNCIWMRYADGAWKACPRLEAEDGIIAMRRVTTPNLTELLRERAVAPNDLKEIIRKMTARGDELTERLKEHNYPLQKESWQDLFISLLEQAEPWALLADPAIPSQWSRDTIIKLVMGVRNSAYLTAYLQTENAAALDCHSDNVFVVNGKPEFLDSMLPKEGWRIVDPFCNTSKLAVDVTTYLGDGVRDELYTTYAEIHPLPPEEVRQLYEAAYAFLKCVYVALVGPKDMVAKYKELVDRYIAPNEK